MEFDSYQCVLHNTLWNKFIYRSANGASMYSEIVSGLIAQIKEEHIGSFLYDISAITWNWDWMYCATLQEQWRNLQNSISHDYNTFSSSDSADDKV